MGAAQGHALLLGLALGFVAVPFLVEGCPRIGATFLAPAIAIVVFIVAVEAALDFQRSRTRE